MSSSLQAADNPDVFVAPMTFLQVYQTAGALMDAMLECDATYQRWFGSSRVWRTLARLTVIPSYYHLVMSGFAAMSGSEIVGWLYLRGWQQVMVVATLATRPGWRGKGVGTRLLRFAEMQALELNREWMALSVTEANEPARRLYAREGFEGGHGHVLMGPAATPGSPGTARLRPVYGIGAERAYRDLTRLDVQVGNAWAAQAILRFLDYDPHRLVGREWVIEVGGRAVAFLNRHGRPGSPRLYLAAEPEWWGRSGILDAALSVVGPRANRVVLRLASSGHHQAALAALRARGFEERPAQTVRLFKRLTDGRPAAQPHTGG